MPTAVYILISIAVGVVAGAAIGLIYRASLKPKREAVELEKKSALEDAGRQAAAIRKEASVEAKDIVYQAKSEGERELKERRLEQGQMEKRLRQKDETLDRKLEQAEKKDQELSRREKDFTARERG